MGQGMSCGAQHENKRLFSAAQLGEVDDVAGILEREPSAIYQTTVYDRHSVLHIAAANGQIEIVSMLLDRAMKPDLLNRHKQTPLMLAAMHGKIACVQKLIDAGANILMFDTIHERTCLHYAAYYGHTDCLQIILDAARTSHVAATWGFARFVNIRDGQGATPLHLASRQRRPECVHVLLDNGALVCASTGGFGFPGSTPLHLAARGGSIDCIRELLAWGADRIQRDALGRIPYTVALKHNNIASAALLNPSSAEPLVWPSPLKFISELKADAKALLERALMDANREREKVILKGTCYSVDSASQSDGDDISEASETDLCCICFDHVCTVQVENCGHQMCAHCTLALCCHNKPNPATSSLSVPVCPFCRCNIIQIIVAKSTKPKNEIDHDNFISSKLRKSRKSINYSEGSSSFKNLSAMSSFSKMGGRSSGRIAAENDWADKP